jgi:hypothetical protein
LLFQRRDIDAKPTLGRHPGTFLLQQPQRAQPAARRLLLLSRQADFLAPFDCRLPEPALLFRLLPQHPVRPVETLPEQQGGGDASGEVRQARIERNATRAQQVEHRAHAGALFKPIDRG